MIAPRVRAANTRFVCATAASYGYGAVLARRPFGCWVATSLRDELRARRPALDGARRAALAAGAPVLLACERATLRRARVLWAISPASRRALALAARVPEGRIRVVPIPVDTKRYRSTKTSGSAGSSGRDSSSSGAQVTPARILRSCWTRSTGCGPGFRPCGSRSSASRPRSDCPTASTCSARWRQCRSRFGMRRSSSCRRCRKDSGWSSPRRSRPACRRSSLRAEVYEELIRSSAAAKCSPASRQTSSPIASRGCFTDRDRLVAMRGRGRAYVVREHDPARLRGALGDALEELRWRLRSRSSSATTRASGCCATLSRALPRRRASRVR